MSLDNVLSNIMGYCRLFAPSTEEKESAIETSKELVSNPTLTKIQKLGKSLITSEEDKIGLLLEVDREVRTLDKYCTTGTTSMKRQTPSFLSQAEKARLQIERIIQSVDEALLETFLKLDSSDQNDQLGNNEFLKKMENFIRNADQGRIRDTESGDVLFHQFLRCKSEKARQLALLCLDAGAEINCKNSRGATGLHLATQIGDGSLVKELINRGADQSIRASFRLLTPLDIAIKSCNYSCALALALKDPLQKIEERSAPEYFIKQLRYSGRDIEAENLVQLLEEFSRKEEINSYADGIWEACKEVTIAWEKEKFNDLEVVIDWLLSHDVRSETSSEKQFLVINWLAERILERKLSGKNDEALLEKMIDSGFLSIAISASNRSIPLEIHQQIRNGQFTVSPRLTDKITELTESVPLGAYEDLNKLVCQIKSDSDLSSQSEIYRKIEERIVELREKDFPNMNMIETKLKEVIAWEISRIEEYRSVLLKLSEGKDVEGVGISVYNYLLDQFVENSRWDLIPKLVVAQNKYSQNFLANKLIYHLMMDKLLFEGAEKYKSFEPVITANALILALNRVRKISPQKAGIKDLEEAVSSIHGHLTPLLKEFILQSDLRGFYNDPKKSALRVVEKLQGLEEGACLLVPTGCNGHATCLLIEKIDSEHFRMTHYNTGKGAMKWHYRGEQTNRCQTFDIVDNVPSESILNQQGWESLFYNQFSNSSMDPIYESLRNTLGKGGERLARSEHDEDYETKQSAGTCAMQSLMALLRHQIMELTEGSPSERKVLYELFKTQMFTQFHLDHLEQIDETINRNLSTVLNKLNAQWTLVEISDNMEDFDEALTSITDILDGLGEKKLAKILLSRDKTTNLSRYATLRNASNILCGAWLKHPEAIPPTELKQQKVLQLAFAKFEHKSAIIRNIDSRLQKHSVEGDMKGLAFELSRTILATSFAEMGIQEAVKRLGKEKSPYEGTQQLLKHLNSYREQSEPVVQEFKLLLLKDNPKLGEWVESFWQELGKGPVEKGKTFD